jgi:diacylglycerol diphosphate phosphatase/phosphatidate phosphatase
MMAFSAYRMVYASVWDFRFNHIPLLRHAPFVYGAGASSFDGFHDAIFTRKGGAPGDAADGPRGTMAPQSEGPHHGHHGSTSSRVQRKPLGSHSNGRHGEQMV